MVRQKNNKKRKRGRPRSGRNPLPLVGLRLGWEDLHRLDRYARGLGVNRSQAIRNALDLAFEGAKI